MSKQTLKDVVRDIIAPMIVNPAPFSIRVQRYLLSVVNDILNDPLGNWPDGFHTRWLRNDPPLPYLPGSGINIDIDLVDFLCARRTYLCSYLQLFFDQMGVIDDEVLGESFPVECELTDEESLSRLLGQLRTFLKTHLHSNAEALEQLGMSRYLIRWMERGEIPDHLIDLFLNTVFGWTRDHQVPDFSFEIWYQLRTIAPDMIERALKSRVESLTLSERTVALDEALRLKRQRVEEETML
jgi:hypothetical protein